jgi:hypothetical protein
MSELKSVYIDRTGDWCRSENNTGKFYLKSEVDAAIAELKDRCQMHDFFWEGCGFAKRGFKNTIAVSEAFDRLEAENAELKAENERLNYALDKERSETIKYMDGLSNAKNEIERLTIDKRNAELRENVADATVEKLKAETAELKQKLEDAKATAYAESVDAGMENRKLKHALWLARAERANDKARIFYFAETCGVKLNIDGYSNKEKGHTRMCTARLWRITWLKVERKCREKAEKFK